MRRHYKFDKYVAYCKACKKSFHIDGEGYDTSKVMQNEMVIQLIHKKLKSKEHCQHQIIFYSCLQDHQK